MSSWELPRICKPKGKEISVKTIYKVEKKKKTPLCERDMLQRSCVPLAEKNAKQSLEEGAWSRAASLKLINLHG